MSHWLFSKLNVNYLIYNSSTLLTNVDFALQTSFISNCFVLLIILMYIITTIYSIGYFIFEREKKVFKFHFFAFCSVISCIGLAYSKNLFTAFIFYDLLSIFTYILVKHNNKNEETEQNAFKYAMYLIIPSTLLLLPAIIFVYNIAEHVDFEAGGILSKCPISKMYINILFFLFMYGISKTAIYPLHKWLIHAMVAPSPVSALLHAVLVVKGGLFLLYKVINEIFGLQLLNDNIYTFFGINWPIYIAAISIIFAGMSATASVNIKKRLAYSTISQIGYISLCLFCFTENGLFGAKMHFLSHSFAKISLFYYAGYLLSRYHCENINELKYQRNHFNFFLSLLWLIPCASLMSMPLTMGYISKHAVIFSVVKAKQDLLILIVVLIGTLLCVSYMQPIVYHLILFKNNKRFTGQYGSTFCVYFSAFIIAMFIICGTIFLSKIH